MDIYPLELSVLHLGRLGEVVSLGTDKILGRSNLRYRTSGSGRWRSGVNTGGIGSWT